MCSLFADPPRRFKGVFDVLRKTLLWALAPLPAQELHGNNAQKYPNTYFQAMED